MESAGVTAASSGGGGGGGGGSVGGGGASTPARASGPSGEPTREEILQTFQEMQRQRDLYIQKIAELNAEHAEYRRVVEIVRPLDPARKCFQLINSVLVERTLGEVQPIVELSRDNLAALIKDLEQRHTKAVADIREFSARFGSA
jgi:prefoldin subunit 2